MFAVLAGMKGTICKRRDANFRSKTSEIILLVGRQRKKFFWEIISIQSLQERLAGSSADLPPSGGGRDYCSKSSRIREPSFPASAMQYE